MRNLLGSPDYDAIVSVMSDPSDNLVDSSYAQLLIDFILQVCLFSFYLFDIITYCL